MYGVPTAPMAAALVRFSVCACAAAVPTSVKVPVPLVIRLTTAVGATRLPPRMILPAALEPMVILVIVTLPVTGKGEFVTGFMEILPVPV